MSFILLSSFSRPWLFTTFALSLLSRPAQVTYQPCQKAYLDSREKDNKGNRRLTVHVCLKPAHLIALPGHLSLQAPDLLLALPDLHGEPGGHTLGCNLQVPLPLGLLLEVADPLLSVGTLLASQLSPCAELLYGPEQIVSLLP